MNHPREQFSRYVKRHGFEYVDNNDVVRRSEFVVNDRPFFVNTTLHYSPSMGWEVGHETFADSGVVKLQAERSLELDAVLNYHVPFSAFVHNSYIQGISYDDLVALTRSHFPSTAEYINPQLNKQLAIASELVCYRSGLETWVENPPVGNKWEYAALRRGFLANLSVPLSLKHLSSNVMDRDDGIAVYRHVALLGDMVPTDVLERCTLPLALRKNSRLSAFFDKILETVPDPEFLRYAYTKWLELHKETFGHQHLAFLALARNPHVPVDVAVQLIDWWEPEIRQAVRDNAALPVRVRTLAAVC